MLLHFAPFLCYGCYYLLQWNKKVKEYNNIKSCKPFQNVKCLEVYICRWIYCQQTYARYMQLSEKNETNMTTVFTIEHDKFGQLLLQQQTWRS